MDEFLSHQLVLIADDEPSVVKLTATIITRMGLTPLTVTDGAEAIKAIEDHHAHICCVILDMMMPIMNGVDAALAIQQIAPNMPIIIMSGSGMGDYPKSIKDLRLANTLTKPFTVDHFRTSVRHAINSLNEKQCITPPALNAAFRTSDSAGVPIGMLQIRANMPKEYRDD